MNVVVKKSADTKTDARNPHVTREHNIGGKKYIVKSVFIGKHDIQTSLLNLAERKTIREMGMDIPVQK